MTTEPKGRANYSAATGLLVITTLAKRDKKTVELVRTYRVEDVDPDPRVAYPAFSLHKLKDGEPTGEVWHIAVEQYGPTCSCQDCVYRSRKCKHLRAAIVVGLMPK